MSEIFICHAGAGLEDSKGIQTEMGIIGVAYYWDGEWIRSPEEVENRESNPIMKLRPVFGKNVEVWGDTGCFSSVGECIGYVEDFA